MRKIAIFLLLASLLSLGVMAAKGDNLLLESAGTKIIEVCGETMLNPAKSCINGQPSAFFDGNKWCCVPDREGFTTHPQPVPPDWPHFIVFDMGAEKSFDGYLIDHAESAGEGSGMNTKSWILEVSNDGKTWVKIHEAKDVFEPTTTVHFGSAIKARYAKFTIPEAEQSAGNVVGTIRIYTISLFESAAAGTFPSAPPSVVTTEPPPTTTRVTTTRATTTTVATSATTAGATTTAAGATTTAEGAATTAAAAEDDGGGLSMGVIIGIIAGAVVVIGVVVFVVMKGKKKS